MSIFTPFFTPLPPLFLCFWKVASTSFVWHKRPHFLRLCPNTSNTPWGTIFILSCVRFCVWLSRYVACYCCAWSHFFFYSCFQRPFFYFLSILKYLKCLFIVFYLLQTRLLFLFWSTGSCFVHTPCFFSLYIQCPCGFPVYIQNPCLLFI